MPALPEIHSDIRSAHTLPGWCYGDGDLHERVRSDIMARSWQFVGDTDLIKVPQQVHPFTLLEGCVDEPLLLTRDADDVMHCMSNACTHRGNLVAGSPCRAAHLRCPYHGRRFALDGTFEHMPEFDNVEGFPSKADNLPAARLERLGRFLFTAVDPAWDFDAFIGPLRERIAWLPLDTATFDPSRSRDYLVQANWALYCDNYLEGFHIPFVHASLNSAIDYGSYRTELFELSNLQVGISKGGEHVFDLPVDSPDAGESIAAYYFWLFPNLMFNVYPWGISVNVVRPLGPTRTKISFQTWVWDESKLDQGAGAGLDRVEREDEAVVEAVQIGVRSRLYDRGRYSPTREQGVHHFHRLLTRFLAGGASA